MKIENGWKTMILDKVSAGTLIYYNGKFYMVTTIRHAPSYLYCVNMNTGELDNISTAMLVTVVDKAVLKIEG